MFIGLSVRFSTIKAESDPLADPGSDSPAWTQPERVSQRHFADLSLLSFESPHPTRPDQSRFASTKVH